MEFGFQDTTETMAFISNIPFVKKLIKQNVKLQKKNKELKQLIKLITKNFDLFQHEEKLEIVGKPIKLEKTDLDVTELDDEVLVVEPPTNIKYEVHEIESDDTDVVNTSCYDTYERPVESCFDAILNSVKTIEDFNKLTNFYQNLWLQNNSLENLVKKEPEEKVIKVKEEKVEKEEEEEDEEEVVEEDEEVVEEEVVEEDEDEVVEEEVVEEEDEEEEEEVEEEEEDEEEEEEDEEEVVEDEDEEEEVVEDEEEEEDVYEIIINKKTYYTNDMKNGILYADDNGEVGEEVGKLTDGVHKFNKKKK